VAVISINLHKSFMQVMTGRKLGEHGGMLRVAALTWLLPAVVVLISAVADRDAYGTPDYCWIDVNSDTLYAFAAPIAALCVINLFVLGAVMRTLGSNVDRRAALKAAVAFFFMLGLGWIFGLVLIVNRHVVWQYLFSTFLAVQGIIIFVTQCLGNRRVRRAVQKSLRITTTASSSGVPQTDSTSFENRTNSSRHWGGSKRRVPRFSKSLAQNSSGASSVEDGRPRHDPAFAKAQTPCGSPVGPHSLLVDMDRLGPSTVPSLTAIGEDDDTRRSTSSDTNRKVSLSSDIDPPQRRSDRSFEKIQESLSRAGESMDTPNTESSPLQNGATSARAAVEFSSGRSKPQWRKAMSGQDLPQLEDSGAVSSCKPEGFSSFSPMESTTATGSAEQHESTLLSSNEIGAAASSAPREDGNRPSALIASLLGPNLKVYSSSIV